MNGTQQPFISGILLAAGLSTRMGEPKQLLPFGGSTIIETVVNNMLQAKFNEVIVVIGHCADKIQPLLNDLPVKTVFNYNYHEGMLTSVQAGVRSIVETTTCHQFAFSIMLVDQPLITSELIDSVIDAYTQTNKRIVLPSYNNRRGHPAIFHNKYADAILALDAKSDGVRSLYKGHSEDIQYVNVDTDAVLRDIDYKEDYENALNEYQ